MLVLTRNEGEAVVIRDETGQKLAVIHAVKCESGKVKIGFTADNSIRIDRLELDTAKQKAKG